MEKLNYFVIILWFFCIFSVEIAQGDQPACGKTIKADIIFVYDSGSLGSKKVKAINKFIVGIVENFNMATGNIRTGIITANCYRGDINLEDHTDKNSFIKQLQDTEVPDLSSVVSRLRKHGYDEENGGRAGIKKIAILFLDDKIEVPKRVMAETGRAKHSNIEIFVVKVGHGTDDKQVKDIATSVNHILEFESFSHLENKTNLDECVQRICHGEFPTTLATTFTSRSPSRPIIHQPAEPVVGQIKDYRNSAGVTMVTNIYSVILLLGLLVKHGIM